MSDKSLHQKLMDIQQKLKVPKDLTNEFAGFKYRNLETIEEQIKPLLKVHELYLTLSDEVISVGDRVFVKATASLSDGETIIEISANAQHALNKKGMDEAQLTGACSSYARKYALGGMFLIDDTKDADSMNNTNIRQKTVETPLADAKRRVYEAFKSRGVQDTATMKNAIETAIGGPDIETVEDAELVIKELEGADARQ